MKIRHTLLAATLSFSFATVACDNGAAEEAAAKAAADVAAKKKAEQDARDKRKADRKAKEAADLKAKEDRQLKVAALAVLPEKLPKKVKAACQNLLDAQDAFMTKYFPKPWEKGKDLQLGMTKKSCNDIKVASCQAEAYKAAPEEFKKEVPGFLKACIDKFGDAAQAQAQAAIPAKQPSAPEKK